MTTVAKREALAVLAEVSELAPDMRLGQLFADQGLLGEAHLGRGLGDIEDDELVAVLYRHRRELETRLEGEEQSAVPSGAATSVSGSSTHTAEGE